MRQTDHRYLPSAMPSRAAVIVALAVLASATGTRVAWAQPAASAPLAASVQPPASAQSAAPTPPAAPTQSAASAQPAAHPADSAKPPIAPAPQPAKPTTQAPRAFTGQRTAAWVLLGTGGASIAAGIALGVLAVVEHRKVRDIDQATQGSERNDRQQRAYDAAQSARDDFRLGSGITAGTGLGLFVVGGTLLVLDRLDRLSGLGQARGPAPTDGRSAGSHPAAGKSRKRSASLAGFSMVPLVGPALTGAMITLRF